MKPNVEREAGVGRGRIDPLVRQPYRDGDGLIAEQREALELKVWAGGRPDPFDEGAEQLDYLSGLMTGTLVTFARRPTAAPIAERTEFVTAQTLAGRTITLLRA